jgi:mannitol/fructose-specific phosphotransferase system IIA component (Ntr-type)
MNMSTSNQFTFASLFSPDDIICQTEINEHEGVIMALLKRLAHSCDIGNVDDIYNAVMRREEVQSTIIAPGLALPHVRIHGLKELKIAIATSTKGIAYKKDNTMVNLIILVIAPKDAPSLYLQILTSISQMLTEKPAVIQEIASLNTSDDVWRYFDHMWGHLPGYVCAGDIMEPVLVSLKDHDTLQTAIDLFVKHDLTDLPVVDKEGEFIGVVTAHALLRVCLPDYILWLEDLSPIIHFEPFADVLRKESNTWHEEIMSTEYAVVDEKAPAIQVAKEITANNSSRAYVLREKKLIGVITLQHFLNKILRD